MAVARRISDPTGIIQHLAAASPIVKVLSHHEFSDALIGSPVELFFIFINPSVVRFLIMVFCVRHTKSLRVRF